MFHTQIFLASHTVRRLTNAWGGECKAEERLQFTGGMAH